MHTKYTRRLIISLALGALPCISMASTESKKTLRQRIDKMIDDKYPDMKTMKKLINQESIFAIKTEQVETLIGLKDHIYNNKENLPQIAESLIHNKINIALQLIVAKTTQIKKTDIIIDVYKKDREKDLKEQNVNDSEIQNQLKLEIEDQKDEALQTIIIKYYSEKSEKLNEERNEEIKEVQKSNDEEIKSIINKQITELKNEFKNFWMQQKKS